MWKLLYKKNFNCSISLSFMTPFKKYTLYMYTKMGWFAVRGYEEPTSLNY